MALPNFLCVGAQKSGTTSLYQILKSHPEVFLPDKKELHFFNEDSEYEKGIEYYERYFAGCRGEKAVGEITPAYIYFENVPGRIRETLGGDVKLIFIFRNPATRAYSQYLMSLWKGYEKEGFRRALELEEKRMGEGYNKRRSLSYVTRGLYARQVKRYLEHFPRENMLFLVLEEDFFDAREEAFENLLSFLGVGRAGISFDVQAYQSKLPRFPLLNRVMGTAYPVLTKILPGALKRRIKSAISTSPEKLDSEESERLIMDRFIDDIMELEGLIGRSLECWYGGANRRL